MSGQNPIKLLPPRYPINFASFKIVNPKKNRVGGLNLPKAYLNVCCYRESLLITVLFITDLLITDFF